MEKKTLVEVALEKSKPSQELFDLAVAFFSGRISGGAVNRAQGIARPGDNRTWSQMAKVLRNGIKCGMGKIVVSVEK